MCRGCCCFTLNIQIRAKSCAWVQILYWTFTKKSEDGCGAGYVNSVGSKRVCRKLNLLFWHSVNPQISTYITNIFEMLPQLCKKFVIKIAWKELKLRFTYSTGKLFNAARNNKIRIRCSKVIMNNSSIYK